MSGGRDKAASPPVGVRRPRVSDLFLRPREDGGAIVGGRIRIGPFAPMLVHEVPPEIMQLGAAGQTLAETVASLIDAAQGKTKTETKKT